MSAPSKKLSRRQRRKLRVLRAEGKEDEALELEHTFMATANSNGSAHTARRVQHKVHSFDLVAANDRVTACDMAHVRVCFLCCVCDFADHPTGILQDESGKSLIMTSSRIKFVSHLGKPSLSGHGKVHLFDLVVLSFFLSP